MLAKQGLDLRQVTKQQERQIGLALQRARGPRDDDPRRRVAAHRVQAYGQAHREGINGGAVRQAR